MLRIKLLERRLEDGLVGAVARARHRRAPAVCVRRLAGGRGCPPPAGLRACELDPFDDLAAADLEDLHDRAGGSDPETERIAIAEARPRHFLLALLERLNRAQRVAELRRLLVAFLDGRLGHAH